MLKRTTHYEKTRSMHRRHFLFILLLVPLSQLSIDQYLPSLPSMTIDFGTSKQIIQLTITLYLLGLSISQLICGAASDHYGRKKILLFALSIYAVSSLVASLTTMISVILTCRFLQGIGIGAGSIFPKAIARDLFVGVRLTKCISWITIVWTITTIFAPPLGGYVQKYFGWRANFYVFFLSASLLIILFSRFFPETNPTRQTTLKYSSIFSSYKLIVTNKLFLAYSFFLTLAFSILIAISLFSTYLLQSKLHITPEDFGKVMMLVGLAYIFGNLCNNLLIKYFKVSTVNLLSTLIIVLSALNFLLVSLIVNTTLLTFILPLLFIVFGIGIIYANYMANVLSIFPNLAGSASAVLGSLLMLGSSFISFIVGQLNTTSQLPLAILLMGISSATITVFILINKEEKQPS